MAVELGDELQHYSKCKDHHKWVLLWHNEVVYSTFKSYDRIQFSLLFLLQPESDYSFLGVLNMNLEFVFLLNVVITLKR